MWSSTRQTKNNNQRVSGNKKNQGRATDDKLPMAMTNMTVCYSCKTTQSTSDKPSVLNQIKARGVSIYNGYKWKYESI